MRKLLRALAVVVLGLSLTTGIAAANASIDTTGPGSRNEVEIKHEENRRVRNNNDVRVRNNNPQTARSGDATADWNTTAGDAETGDAENDSLLRATLRVNNSGAMNGGGSTNSNSGSYDISNTGPNSRNEIEFRHNVDWSVTNNNDIKVENNNSQRATSGDAVVSGNTTGGSASSGNASNISTTDVTVEITN